MTAYSQGQVVLIPFPFTDLTTTKQRPAVILSSDVYNRTHPDLILAAITSQIPAKLQPDEYLLSGTDQKTAGLPKPSVIKLGKIVTIDQRLIRRVLGNLPVETTKKVKEVFQKNF
jgi:mRNA interferase MazF